METRRHREQKERRKRYQNERACGFNEHHETNRCGVLCWSLNFDAIITIRRNHYLRFGSVTRVVFPEAIGKLDLPFARRRLSRQPTVGHGSRRSIASFRDNFYDFVGSISATETCGKASVSSLHPMVQGRESRYCNVKRIHSESTISIFTLCDLIFISIVRMILPIFVFESLRDFGGTNSSTMLLSTRALLPWLRPQL
mmetsp:Transcript_10476/g.25290  ORF Transcript_10476/g.25290 Transcript_10476/m.25290 type:complete len:198 (-) Transcript_10476:13-606(-)